MTTDIAPLRKTTIDGKLYLRPKEIVAKLQELCVLPRLEIARRCELQPDNPQYLPSECLVYLVREHRSGPDDEHFEVIFKALLSRFIKGISKTSSGFAATEDLVESNIRDEARSNFLQLLSKDRNGDYQTRLDFFEIRFNMCVAGVRNDAKRKVYKHAKVHQPMRLDEDGEISAEIALAARGYTPFGPDQGVGLDYATRLDQAIDVLPEIQKTIVLLLRNGVQIQSDEPETVTISGTLNKTPKTIAKYRDLAFATLKKSLKGEAL